MVLKKLKSPYVKLCTYRTREELLKCEYTALNENPRKVLTADKDPTNEQLALYGISCSRRNANAGMMGKQVNYQITKANFGECCFQLIVYMKSLFIFVHLRGFKIKITVEYTIPVRLYIQHFLANTT